MLFYLRWGEKLSLLHNWETTKNKVFRNGFSSKPWCWQTTSSKCETNVYLQHHLTFSVKYYFFFTLFKFGLTICPSYKSLWMSCYCRSDNILKWVHSFKPLVCIAAVLLKISWSIRFMNSTWTWYITRCQGLVLLLEEFKSQDFLSHLYDYLNLWCSISIKIYQYFIWCMIFFFAWTGFPLFILIIEKAFPSQHRGNLLVIKCLCSSSWEKKTIYEALSHPLGSHYWANTINVKCASPVGWQNKQNISHFLLDLRLLKVQFIFPQRDFFPKPIMTYNWCGQIYRHIN